MNAIHQTGPDFSPAVNPYRYLGRIREFAFFPQEAVAALARRWRDENDHRAEGWEILPFKADRFD